MEYAIVTAVVREGPDVVVKLRNAQLERQFFWFFLRHLRFKVTVRFVDARRINSVNCLNRDVACRLEPGWRVFRLDFDDLSAHLYVDYTDMDMSITVYHQIWCDAVELRMRFTPLDMLRAYYFPATFCSVSREPAPSPPIAGQEGPMP